MSRTTIGGSAIRPRADRPARVSSTRALRGGHWLSTKANGLPSQISVCREGSRACPARNCTGLGRNRPSALALTPGETWPTPPTPRPSAPPAGPQGRFLRVKGQLSWAFLKAPRAASRIRDHHVSSRGLVMAIVARLHREAAVKYRRRQGGLETYAFALANSGNVTEAIAKLEELLILSGPTPERLGLLGGRYKRLYSNLKEEAVDWTQQFRRRREQLWRRCPHGFRRRSEIRAAGVTSLGGIAKELSARHIPTASGGSVWAEVQVSRVLQRRRPIGAGWARSERFCARAKPSGRCDPLAQAGRGRRSASERAPTLDGVSWVQGCEVENTVGWVSRVRQNWHRRLLPPRASLVAGAGCGLFSGG